MHSDYIATLSIVISGFLGTGGAGYALVQWLIKRNDEESKANAARILTDAATGIVVELRSENKRIVEKLIALQKCSISMIRFMAEVEDYLPQDRKGEYQKIVSCVEEKL